MPRQTPLKATVVIPAHGRENLLARAYNSVLSCPGSESVEIIIVDDASAPPISLTLRRAQDRLIRLRTKSGAAVARNAGIRSASGQIIYLLDSDDYFIERDFDRDAGIFENGSLYYCDTASPDRSHYPSQIGRGDLINFLMFKHAHICQTSTLAFSRDLGLRFDETLPKHQDWDLVLCAALQGISLHKAPGLVYFDRSDKESLSRSYDPSRSMPWIRKIRNLRGLSPEDVEIIHYHVFAKYPSEISWRAFGTTSIGLLFHGRTSIRFILRALAHRLIQYTMRLRRKH